MDCKQSVIGSLQIEENLNFESLTLFFALYTIHVAIQSPLALGAGLFFPENLVDFAG
jgi:hypothetical protein